MTYTLNNFVRQGTMQNMKGQDNWTNIINTRTRYHDIHYKHVPIVKDNWTNIINPFSLQSIMTYTINTFLGQRGKL